MFDNTKVGQLTEKIMKYFGPIGQMPLETPEYNKVWSHVHDVLRTHSIAETYAGKEAIEFCLQCLQAGCNADEILSAWVKKGQQ